MLRVVFLLCLALTVYGGDHNPKPAATGANAAGGGHNPKPAATDSNAAAAADAPSTTSVAECNDCFQTATDCLMQSFKDHEDRIKKQFEDKKPKLEACFTDNKCKVPTPPQRKEDPNALKKMQCGMAVMEKGKKFVGDCILKKFSDLKLPEMNFSSSNKHHFHPEQICGILDEACPAEANRTNVTLCLFKTFAGDMKSLRSDYNQLCAAGRKCIGAMKRTGPASCEDKFFEVKTSAEGCIFKAFGANLTADVPECQGLDHSADQAGKTCNLNLNGMHAQGGKPAMKQQNGASRTGAHDAGKQKNICGNFQEYLALTFGYGHQGHHDGGASGSAPSGTAQNEDGANSESGGKSSGGTSAKKEAN
jgi:hypothetical protein